MGLFCCNLSGTHSCLVSSRITLKLCLRAKYLIIFTSFFKNRIVVIKLLKVFFFLILKVSNDSKSFFG